MDDKKQECRGCRFWSPRYQGVGTCRAEGRVGAKFWVLEEKTLLTIASFSCQSWERVKDTAEDTI